MNTLIQSFKWAALSVAAVALTGNAVQARDLSRMRATVVGVESGDTVVTKLIDSGPGLAVGSTLKFHLARIQAPETSGECRGKAQPFATESTEFLSKLALRQQVELRCMYSDKAGALPVCDMLITDQTYGPIGVASDAATVMVKSGYAWVNEGPASESAAPKGLQLVQSAAQASGAGLWAQGKDAVAPWIWKKNAMCGTKPSA